MLPIIERPGPAAAASSQAGPRVEKGTYAFVSLGCPKNLVDSERMLGLLQLDGYRLVPEPEGADLVVVNTCGFIEQARQESYGAIREMLALKWCGGTRGVIVSGCLAEREKEALLEAMPGSRLSGGGFRPRISDQSGRPAAGGIARAAHRISAGAGRTLVGSIAAADYAAAFRLSEDLGRLRPAVHVLRDTENARQACHEADGRSAGRGAN